MRITLCLTTRTKVKNTKMTLFPDTRTTENNTKMTLLWTTRTIGENAQTMICMERTQATRMNRTAPINSCP